MAKVALMITSCDAYKECWKPMIYSLDKYWSDCEYPRYLITNYEKEDLPNTTIVNIGNDNHSWCTLAKKGLASIDCDYIIFFQEDYWLGRKVNNEAIKKHVEYVVKNDLDYLKIQYDLHRDERRIGNTDYCDNEFNIRYAFNTAIAIWKKDTIDTLLIEGWSGWEFERQITPYIKENGLKFKSQTLHSSCYPDKGIKTIDGDAIVRGVWTHSAVKFLKDNGFEDLLSKRDVMGPITNWLYSHCPDNRSVFRWPFWAALKILKDYKKNW